MESEEVKRMVRPVYTIASEKGNFLFIIIVQLSQDLSITSFRFLEKNKNNIICICGVVLCGDAVVFTFQRNYHDVMSSLLTSI